MTRFFQWPEADTGTIITAVLLIILLILIFVILRLITKAHDQKQAYWVLMERLLHSHHLKQPHIDFIKQKVLALPKEELMRLMSDREYFRKKITSMIAHAMELDREAEVQILERLFQKDHPEVPVDSVYHIYPADYCAVEVGDNKWLGIVVKTKDAHIAVRTVSGHLSAEHLGQEAKLYFFRPLAGGFMLNGKIQKVLRDGIIFEFTGTLAAKDEVPLSLPIGLEYTLLYQGSIGLEDDMKNQEDKIPPDVQQGKTVQVSNRGIILELDEKYSDWLGHSHIWSMDLTLSSGETVRIKGYLSPVQRNKNLFSFHYLEMSQEDKKKLYDFLQQMVRERMELKRKKSPENIR